MKKITKILSLSLAFMLSLATAIPTVSFAADPEPTGSITITSYKANNDMGDNLTPGSLKDRTFVAYRILNGKTADGTHVGYTIPAAMKKFYQEWDWELQAPNTSITPAAASNMLRIAEVDDVSTSQQPVVQNDNVISDIDIIKAIASLDSQVQFVGSVESSDSDIMLMNNDVIGSGKDEDAFREAVLEHLNGTNENTKELYAFANSALVYAEKAAKNDTYKNEFKEYKVTAGAGASTVTFENLPYGYYVVGEKTGDKLGEAITTALLTAVHTNAPVNIITKDVAPTVNKFITEGEDHSLSEGKEVNSAEIGDIVNFKIVANLPDVQGYTSYTYKVEDTFSVGLTYNNDAVAYYYTDTDVSTESATPIPTDKYTATLVGQVLTINFDGDWILENGIDGLANTHKHETSSSGSSSSTSSTAANNIKIPYIVITYSAKVNDQAKFENTNTVKVIYSNEPGHVEGDGGEGHDGTEKTPPDETKTYVYAVNLIKTGYDSGLPLNIKYLEGAKFKLKNEDGLYANLHESSGVYSLDPVTPWNSTGTDITSVGTATGVKIMGLDVGTYAFVETEAPGGYEPVSGDIEFTISLSENKYDSPKFEEGSDDSSLVTVDPVVTDGVGKITVENIVDGLLPGTGGVGRVMVYALGSILVLGAAVLFVLKRRSGKNA